jgi:hypothetical protein
VHTYGMGLGMYSVHTYGMGLGMYSVHTYGMGWCVAVHTCQL